MKSISELNDIAESSQERYLKTARALLKEPESDNFFSFKMSDATSASDESEVADWYPFGQTELKKVL